MRHTPRSRKEQQKSRYWHQKRIGVAKEDAKRPLIRLPNGSFTFATTPLPT